MGAHRLGRYRLCFELASGGMATVYLARTEGAGGFDKLVALKRIHPHLAREPDFVDMFLDEARIAARITHPNVCPVFDFDHVGDAYYLTMEYLLGETVSRVMRTVAKSQEHVEDRRLPSYIARIIADASEGLHAAHELRGDEGELLNVIHRDISPHNIFVTYDGGVRVVDFGIARAAGRMHHTRTGQIKGKYAYMSPEQLHDEDIDRRADVWGLGVILWEMLTSRRLFRRNTEPDTILAVTQGPIPPPSKYRSTIPSDLDAIVLRALSRDVDKRFQTARELGRALSRFIGRQADPTSMADLADWMDSLFHEEQARRRELVEMARQMGPSPVPKISTVLAAKGEESGAVDIRDMGDAGQTPVPSVATRRPLWRWLAAGAAVALVLGAAALAWPSTHAPPPPHPATAGTVADAPKVGARGTPQTRTQPQLVRRHANAASPGTPGRATQGPKPGAGSAAAVAGTAGNDDANGGTSTDAAGHAGQAKNPARALGTDSATTAPTGTVHGSGTRVHHRALAPGTVTVVTPGGWADIYDGSRRVGRSPDSIQLSAGRHRLRLVPFGNGRAHIARVTVRSGKTARVSVPLQ